jgi:uncharacterized protein YbjQ (UPF0145 family)
MSASSQHPPRIPPAMITTTFEIPGYQVDGHLGIVRGIVVRSRSIIGSIGASLQSLNRNLKWHY